MACLVITASPTEKVGKYFQLGKRTVAGGRDPAREIQIPDPMVSRKHFLIRCEGESHIIVETKAKNGVFVNDEKVSERTLADGDRIHVGDTVLVYYVNEDPDRTNAVMQQRRADRELREDMTQMPERT
jgi:pSer/pThr/pTyr-binding forkhead associated (FHA) protein